MFCKNVFKILHRHTNEFCNVLRIIYWLSKNCQFIQKLSPHFQVYLGFVLKSGSIYKEGFDRSMGWTRPFHLPSLWEEHDMYYDLRLPKRAWWLETGQTEKLQHSAGTMDDDLTLKHISGAFYSWIGCLVISGIVFLYEMLFYYRKKITRHNLAVFYRSKLKIGNESTAIDDFVYSNRDGFT